MMNITAAFRSTALLLMFFTQFSLQAQNNCLHFDGVDDHVNLGTFSPTGNFTTGFTFMGWVKWDAFNMHALIFSMGDDVNNGVNTNLISISGSGTQQAINIRCSNNSMVLSSNIIPNQWIHIAFTVNENGYMTAFINGTETYGINVSPIADVVRTSCFLGGADNDYYGKFNGALDEVSIWSRALTITEVQNKMNSSLAGNENGLYAYYRFNQGAPEGLNTTCIKLLDAGVNTKDGALADFALSGSTSNWLSSDIAVEIENNALALDGTNDYIDLGTLSPTGNFTTGFTYMGWIKWDTFNPWSRLFDIGNGQGVNNILLACNGTNNSITLSNYMHTTPYQITTGKILSTNQWVHIAATISNFGEAKIYVNGVVAAMGNVNTPANIVRNLCFLGKSNWGADAYLDATIDEVSLWTRALSTDEINNYMNKPLNGGEPELYIYFSFNQGLANGTNTGLTNLIDASPNAINGTLSNFSLSNTSSNWVSSQAPATVQNNALSFDGINDYVALPALGSNLTQFTIETWFNTNSFATPGNYNSIFNSNTWTTGDVHFQFVNQSGTLQLELAVSGSLEESLTYNFSTNTWYHLAATYNATEKTSNIYVNGELALTSTLTTAINANLTSAQIGAWLSSRHFNGKIDNFRIWNTERTKNEISDNMYKSFNDRELGLLASYNFNQGNAEYINSEILTLNNGTGINHGTLNNFSLTGTLSNWVTGIKARPDNHVSNFSGAIVSSKITLTWADIINTNSPDGYYIYASKTNSFSDPVNGIEPIVDNNLIDGTGVVKVLQGVQSYDNWVNTELSTTYFFRIYPYTNSDANILFNTSATVPQVEITSAGQFSIQDDISFPALKYSTSAWGDYNNDGNMDLVLAGDSSSIPITRIFKGDGLGGFAPQYKIELRGVQYGSVAWGDYNNDGYLDILLTGSDRSAWPPTPFTRIYKNNKDESFSEQTQIELFPIYNGSAVWGDFDNDGDLDILLTGNGAAKIYRNNGDNSFTDLVSMNGVTYGSASWCDFNNDGFLDVIYSGLSNNGNRTVNLYKNNGNKTFSLITDSGLPNFLGVVACGDYNNDGLTDLFIGNYNGSKIFRNNGNFIFTEQTNILGANENSSASWIDFDNDGLLDLSVCGRDWYNNDYCKIFRNIDGNTFNEVAPQSWPNLWGNAVWADFNNDMRLDFMLTGYSSSFAGLYQNNIKNFNTPPVMPENLEITKQTNSATFKWFYPSNEEPAKFNLRVGTTSGSSNIVTAQALADGKRLLFNNLTLIGDSAFTLSPMRIGNYFWSVQSVDGNGIASPFAPEESFSIDSIQASNLMANNVNNSTIKLKWKRGNGDGCIVFCKANKTEPAYPENGIVYKHSSHFGEGSRIAGTDWFCVYNGIADSAIISGLYTGLTYTVHVMEYSTNENVDTYYRLIEDDNIGFFSPSPFTDLQNLTSEGVLYGSAEWGDFDNDGYLDILAAGVLYENNFYAKVYKNNGDNTFTILNSFTMILPDNPNNRMNDRIMGKWADFNNDDYLDILIIDSYHSGNAKIYINDADVDGRIFSEQEFFGDDYSTGAIEDLDNDGFLDMVLTGKNGTKIYKNNGDCTFSLQATIPLIAYNASLSCGDFNNDGLPDILQTAYQKIAEYNSIGKTNIYQNNGNWEFTEKIDVALEGICYGIGQWVDYDNDGHLDIFLSGAERPSDPPMTLLYHNNGNCNFTLNSEHGIANFSNTYTDWGDYNNDGFLDLLIIGESGGSYTKIYANNKNGTFTEDIDINLLGAFRGKAKWCDYDNDGDLDILFAGSNTLKIYQNTSTSIAGKYDGNTQPNPPLALESIVSPNKVTLSWSHVNNDETPSTSMSYNIRYRGIGEANWNHAPKSNGAFRLINTLGNIQMTQKLHLENLPTDEYVWSVQAIDQGFLGSEWSELNTFEVKTLQAFFTHDTVCAGNATHLIDLSNATQPIAARQWMYFNTNTQNYEVVANDSVANFIFPNAGSDSIMLVVEDTEGLRDSVMHTITIKPGPIADFSVAPVCAGNASFFLNNSTIPEELDATWAWNFGDNRTSTQQHPDPHGYLNPATYWVTLKVNTNNGCSDSISANAIVAEIPNALLMLDYGSPTFCPGDSVKYSVPYNQNFNYQWIFNGDVLPQSGNALTIKNNSGDYWVEVTNNLANSCADTSTAKTVTILPIFDIPSIEVNGATTFCEGDSVKLEGPEAEGGIYRWKRFDGTVGANQKVYYAKTSGQYTLTLENALGCQSHATDTITVTALPSPTLPSVNYGDTEFCDGNSVTFTVNNNSSHFYQWKNGTVNIPNATTNQYTATQSGNYWLEVSNASGCAVETQPVAVNVYPIPPTPLISEQDNQTNYCPGTVVHLQVDNQNSAFSYQWKRSGIDIQGATFSALSGQLVAGDYSVEASANICATESGIITLTTKPAPEEPELFARGLNVWILGCSNMEADLYRWYYNGEIIPGAAHYTYVANKNLGDYRVEVNEGGECWAASPTISIPFETVNKSEKLTIDDISVYPNPTDGLFYVSIGKTVSDRLDMQVINYMGQTLPLELTRTNQTLSFDLSDYNSGIYLIKIQHDKNVLFKRIVKY